MKSRAAILPYPGDPFLLNYWLHFFDTFWSDEVDRLYVMLNSPIEKPVVDYIAQLCIDRPKIYLDIQHSQQEHGSVINRALDLVEEQYIMLVEDDGFIFQWNKVASCFEALESGDFYAVGSKRGSCSMEILTRSQQLYGLNYEGEGDQGPNFWPNFFFCDKSLLLTTDRNFAARAWQPNEEIVPLSRPGDIYYARGLVTSDTFVNTSMQIMASIPQAKILYLPQYHGSPNDQEDFERGKNLFDGRAWWTHIGSLSSGVGGILQDGHGRSLARRLIDPDKGENTPIPNYCNTEQEKWEFERRVQWWLKFWTYAADTIEVNTEIEKFHRLYGQAIDRIIDQYQLSRSRILRRQNIYATLGL